MAKQISTDKKSRIDLPLFFYNLAIIVFAPYFLARKLLRASTKKTAYEFLPQRFTIPVTGGQKDDPSHLHVVFVSTGFGEKHTTEQLTAALKEIRPNVRTTWAAKADVTVAVMQKEHPEQAATFMPFDFFPSVALWLRKLKPDVVVSVEKLWVPNIIWCSRRYGAPVTVVCGRRGRYRDSGGKRMLWQRINTWTLAGYNSICLQSETELERLRPVLPVNCDVRVTGAIKVSRLASARPTFDVLSAWVKAANTRQLPILVAGSTTNRGEEELVLKAFLAARRKRDCLLLLAPRHLHRVQEVLDLLDEHRLNYVRRVHFDGQESLASGVEILILDSMGELSSAYSFGEAAYVGGTFTGIGHNVIEPVEWDVPVCFGDGAKKNPPTTQELAIEAGAGFRISDGDELAEIWIKILTEPAWREELREKCRHVVEEQKRALEENLRAIVEVVDAVAAQKNR